MLHIIGNARVVNRLRRELAAADTTRPVIRDAEAKAIPYLQACIKEGLRIYPPAAGLMEKVVPAGGDTVDGKFVPAGTKMGVSLWGIMRYEATWGPDADQYRPERWLEASADKLREMDLVVDLAFGGGRWQCLGRTLAYIELGKVISEVSCTPKDERR
jgi:cytochrome P450